MIKLLSIFAIFLPLMVSAIELPKMPNGRSTLSITMFGTTENPTNPPDFRFFVYEMRDDALLTSEARDNKEKPDIKKRITKDEYAAIYKTFKDFFDSHKLSEDPNLIRDGSSIEIKFSVGSESASATFAHNSFRESQDVKTLFELIEKLHPGSTHSLLQQFK
jgi:hypothetical protein